MPGLCRPQEVAPTRDPGDLLEPRLLLRHPSPALAGSNGERRAEMNDPERVAMGGERSHLVRELVGLNSVSVTYRSGKPR